MKRISNFIKYRALEEITLDTEDSIKVVAITSSGDIILSVNGKRITLAEYETQADFLGGI